MGSASDYGAQMLSHDFIKRLARELEFNVGGHRVYGITFNNWVMLMSLHKCARTMCYWTLRLHRATERWRSRGWRRKEEEKRWKVGRRPFICSRPRYLPKMDGPLLLPFVPLRVTGCSTYFTCFLQMQGLLESKEITNEEEDIAVKVLTAWDISTRL